MRLKTNRCVSHLGELGDRAPKPSCTEKSWSWSLRVPLEQFYRRQSLQRVAGAVKKGSSYYHACLSCEVGISSHDKSGRNSSDLSLSRRELGFITTYVVSGLSAASQRHRSTHKSSLLSCIHASRVRRRPSGLCSPLVTLKCRLIACDGHGGREIQGGAITRLSPVKET